MIPFKDITLADKDTITSFTMKSDRRNCDLSFSNLSFNSKSVAPLIYFSYSFIIRFGLLMMFIVNHLLTYFWCCATRNTALPRNSCKGSQLGTTLALVGVVWML